MLRESRKARWCRDGAGRGVVRRRTVRGCDGIVEIDDARRLVTKTYVHPDPGIAARNARREVAYASRFFEALACVEGVTCPRVVAHRLSPRPRVVMSLCPGEGLPDYLMRLDGRGARIAEISGKIRCGLEVYTRLFGEPYYDFCFNNMLFDESSGVLTFLDFIVPVFPVRHGPETPLETSLGRLVGCSCYTLARPAFLFSSTATHLALIQVVVRGFGGRVSEDRIYENARSVFSQMFESGGRFRRSYYRTVGAAVAERCLRALRRPAASTGPVGAVLRH